MRIQFIRVENIPSKPSDPYLKVRVSSWSSKREHVTKKIGIAGGKDHTRVYAPMSLLSLLPVSAMFSLKESESIEAEVWERNVLRDKKLGAFSL